VGLIDRPHAGENATYGSWRCSSLTYTFHAAQVALPPHRAGVHASAKTDVPPVPASDLRYWPRTQALWKQLTTNVPEAEWYLKLDINVFLNLHQLRLVLLTHVPHQQQYAPDYLGKAMSILTYKDEPLK
jgi:hypothetical protein